MTVEALKILFERFYSEPPVSVTPLKPHASPRKLYRMRSSSHHQAIGVHHTDDAENRAFIGFTKHFVAADLPVPSILALHLEEGIYLEEDLGETTLFDVMVALRTADNLFPRQVEDLFEQALEWLVKFQVVAGVDLDYSLCHQSASFDKAAMLFDMEQFRREFLDRREVHYDAALLEEEFHAFADWLSGAETKYFMYRDFQSRNIMVRDEQLCFIDYQSGRQGPLQYDVASLLNQAQAQIPYEARSRLLEHYLTSLAVYIPVNRAEFMTFYDGFVYLRTMQVLGVYGRSGIGEKKEYFFESIGFALRNLRYLVDEKPLAAIGQEMKRVFDNLISERDT